MATPAKTCVKCGQDCANKPRTKDAQGRYTCRECYDKALGAASVRAEVKPLKAAAATPAAAKPVASLKAAVPAGAPKAAVAAPAPPLDEPAFDAAEGLGEGFSLADDAGLGALAAAQPKECANCGLFLPQSTVICTRCGLNTQTGKILGTQKIAGEGRQCIKCGYSLKGLKDTKCPECGTQNFVKTPEELRREREKKDSRAVTRNAYLLPLVVFAIGLTISVVLFSALGANTQGALVFLLMRYVLFVPIAVVVYFVCCLIWIGFDAPIHLTALRLAAALAITDPLLLPAMALSVYGIGLMACALGLAMYKLMDLEVSDSVIVAVILVVLQRGILIAIAEALKHAQ